MKTFVAFLRGINVGGNKKVPMADLKESLEQMGFEQVKTLLNSGNAIFTTDEKKTDQLEEQIEKKLEDTFGFTVPTILRTIDELQTLADSEPFKDIILTPQTRRYVTFVGTPKKSALNIPHRSPDGNFTILSASMKEICSVLTVTKDGQTLSLMDVIEKEYGTDVTTRNWNTVERILKSAL